MTTRTVILLVIFLILALNSYGNQDQKIQYPQEKDPDILIFSPTHGLENYLKEKDGVLEIEITSFYPILQVDIDGKIIDTPKDTKARVSFPYVLESETTEFQISIVSEKGLAQKKFTLHLGSKPDPTKDPFRLITLLEAKDLDNVYSVPDSDEKSTGTKGVLTLIPQIRFFPGEDSVFAIKAIFLMEKFSDSDYASEELAYMQLKTEWQEKRTFLGTISASIGMNDIKTDNSNGSIGSEATSTETFISMGLNQKINPLFKWSLDWKYKLMDYIDEATIEDDETDGGAWTLDAGLGITALGIRSNLTIGYTDNDAMGKYKDYTSSELKLKLSYPLGKLTPSLSYAVETETMAIEDPRQGVTPTETLSTLNIKIAYQLLKSLNISLGYKTETQISNVESSEYTGSTTTLAITHIF